MSLNPIVLTQAAGTGSTQSTTVGANTTVVVNASNFCNTSGGALTVTITANAGADRVLVSAHSIAAGADYQPPALQGLTLPAGAVLKINAAAGIDYWVSGISATT